MSSFVGSACTSALASSRRLATGSGGEGMARAGAAGVVRDVTALEPAW